MDKKNQSSKESSLKDAFIVVGLILVTVIMAGTIAFQLHEFGSPGHQQHPAASFTFDQTYDSTGQVATVEVQLTLAANIDYVEIMNVPDNAEVSSTDRSASAGTGSEQVTMEEKGDVITIKNLSEGDQFTVVGSLNGNKEVLWPQYKVQPRK